MLRSCMAPVDTHGDVVDWLFRFVQRYPTSDALCGLSEYHDTNRSWTLRLTVRLDTGLGRTGNENYIGLWLRRSDYFS
ncbi:MAG: hypothetical protein ABFD89_08075 [Bryobacteraceae bacterium]